MQNERVCVGSGENVNLDDPKEKSSPGKKNQKIERFKELHVNCGQTQQSDFGLEFWESES